MRLPMVLILLLAVAVAAGAGWHFLGAPPVAVETEDDDPVVDAEPSVPDEVPASPGPAVVELPVAVVPRVGILAEGDELPPAGTATPGTQDRLHETLLSGDPSTLSGADLVRQVADAAYLRVGNEADLEALRQLAPDPGWGTDGVPLMEVLELWRRSGFEVESRGQYLLVTPRSE